jgi:hypothetical protein
MFISGASRPRSDKTIYQRANAHTVAGKLLDLSESLIPAAHVVYGRGVDVIALVASRSIEERIAVSTRVRDLKNSPEHQYDFVERASSMPIISMFGRFPGRQEWGRRKKFAGWMFAESSESGPAEGFAVSLLSTENVTFVATLAGEYDVGIFLEADSPEEFDSLIDGDMPMLNSIKRSDTFIIPRSNVM